MAATWIPLIFPLVSLVDDTWTPLIFPLVSRVADTWTPLIFPLVSRVFKFFNWAYKKALFLSVKGKLILSPS
jgi:hypothetical protein